MEVRHPQRCLLTTHCQRQQTVGVASNRRRSPLHDLRPWLDLATNHTRARAKFIKHATIADRIADAQAAPPLVHAMTPHIDMTPPPSAPRRANRRTSAYDYMGTRLRPSPRTAAGAPCRRTPVAPSPHTPPPPRTGGRHPTTTQTQHIALSAYTRAPSRASYATSGTATTTAPPHLYTMNQIHANAAHDAVHNPTTHESRARVAQASRLPGPLLCHNTQGLPADHPTHLPPAPAHPPRRHAFVDAMHAAYR